MATVFDIDTHLRHILEPQHGSLARVQRHKLCYAVLRLGIGLTGDSPFDGRVLAWPLGPVSWISGDDPEWGTTNHVNSLLGCAIRNAAGSADLHPVLNAQVDVAGHA
jgi:hypothetical protein